MNTLGPDHSILLIQNGDLNFKLSCKLLANIKWPFSSAIEIYNIHYTV